MRAPLGLHRAGKLQPLILCVRLDGQKHYGELKRTIHGVSDKVMIKQLKALQADRALARTDYKEAPRASTTRRPCSATAWPSRSSHFVPGKRDHSGNDEHFHRARQLPWQGSEEQLSSRYFLCAQNRIDWRTDEQK